jgi:hypothetical protein
MPENLPLCNRQLKEKFQAKTKVEKADAGEGAGRVLRSAVRILLLQALRYKR